MAVKAEHGGWLTMHKYFCTVIGDKSGMYVTAFVFGIGVVPMLMYMNLLSSGFFPFLVVMLGIAAVLHLIFDMSDTTIGMLVESILFAIGWSAALENFSISEETIDLMDVVYLVYHVTVFLALTFRFTSIVELLVDVSYSIGVWLAMARIVVFIYIVSVLIWFGMSMESGIFPAVALLMLPAVAACIGMLVVEERGSFGGD